jgi:hypothetical protein
LETALSSLNEEFKTITLLRHSDAETRAVDAFALCLIKTERQLRRLLTYLVFQYPCFNKSNVPNLRNTLAAQKRIYFDGFERGIDMLYPRTIRQMVGVEYDNLRRVIDEAIVVRNKIFHGQVTDRYLSRRDLFELVDQLMSWCQLLAASTVKEFSYDGFARNAYRKAPDVTLAQRFKFQFVGIADYETFLKRVSR